MKETGEVEAVQAFVPEVRGGLVLAGVPLTLGPDDVEPVPAPPALALRLLDDDDESPRFPWWGVYFHGEAERFVDARWNFDPPCAPDLVGASVSSREVPDGRHDVTVYGRPAVLFLWERDDRYPYADEDGRPTRWRRGYVVFEDDTVAYELARQRFLDGRRYL